MRKIQASQAKTHLPQILSDVERGETVLITRHGRPIARLGPIEDARASKLAELKAELSEFRKLMPRLSVEDILSARDEGRRG
jgi:prevent-host-death family protein